MDFFLLLFFLCARGNDGAFHRPALLYYYFNCFGFLGRSQTL